MLLTVLRTFTSIKLWLFTVVHQLRIKKRFMYSLREFDILSKDEPVDIRELCRLLRCLLGQCYVTDVDLEWHKKDIKSFEWCLNDELKKTPKKE